MRIAVIGTLLNRVHNQLRAGVGMTPGGGTLNLRLAYTFDFTKYLDIQGNKGLVADGVLDSMRHGLTLRSDYRFLPKTGVFAAIDQRSGQRLWARGMASTQTPLVAGDAVYVVTVDGEAAAIDRATGKVFWVSALRRYEKEKKKKGRISWVGPLMANGKLVLANSLGEGVVLDAETGKEEKTFKVGGSVFVPPISAGGVIYFLTDEAKLVAVR
jgi:outer membrane protein assembly factor BamB